MNFDKRKLDFSCNEFKVEFLEEGVYDDIMDKTFSRTTKEAQS